MDDDPWREERGWYLDRHGKMRTWRGYTDEVGALVVDDDGEIDWSDDDE